MSYDSDPIAAPWFCITGRRLEPLLLTERNHNALGVPLSCDCINQPLDQMKAIAIRIVD